MTTTARVIEILVSEGGYRELPQPLKVGSLSFEFAHALVASNKANDLVIVIELKSNTIDGAIVRKVLALTRALDVLHSRRSVTVVLTLGQAAPETVQSLSRVCRVLPIGAPTGPNANEAVREWLSVLLPLSAPPAVETLTDWEADLRKTIPNQVKVPLVNELLKVAPRGRVAVEETFSRAVSGTVRPALQEDQGDE
jgi:hypothetical protein